jgi:sulfhydrogenase subunit delta
MAPRVVVVGLASDFGCQVQMTNIEDHLLDVLGTIDLVYWQLASSGTCPRSTTWRSSRAR